MAIATNLGFPRIGPRRELKKALEDYWSGKIGEKTLLEMGRAIRKNNWLLQKELGLHHIPSNDFSFYDHVLDTCAMVGAVPFRYGWSGKTVDLPTYFAMARGLQEKGDAGKSSSDLPAMEMTKWFDTNYHYIVPEFDANQKFSLSSTKPVAEYLEAKALGIETRPVLLGPISFLLLGKTKEPNFQPLSLLDKLLPVYEELLLQLANAGAEWVQIDEPCLSLDLGQAVLPELNVVYRRLANVSPRLHMMIAAYFGGLRENLSAVLQLPVSAVHLDLSREPEQLEPFLLEAPADLSLSAGLVDGRNIWRTDLGQVLALAERAVKHRGTDRLFIAPSCSLLHVPVDLDLETDIDDELRGWLSFAKQKVEEIVLLTRAVCDRSGNVAQVLDANRAMMIRKQTSVRIHNEQVKQRLAAVTKKMLQRGSPYPARRKLQEESLRLPLLPTTTIGSFPQTGDVRAARAEFKAGKRDLANYEAFLRAETEKAIRFQEEIGLDLLVHGEFERNDMVEYFGEQLSGFAFTQNGWVQSYGSRCVKPPIIYGDVSRPKPMTVAWSQYAQSLTTKPMKGMLTGPVTILKWSFVRNDQPLADTCRQIALSIRDEVGDLEAAGIRAIQIDEPALREGLPLRRDGWKEYLAWAVDAFRLATSGVLDKTQIHTHMCYAEFNDIIEAIGALDADVISIETSRSQMELLGVFQQYQYPNEIGPGVYDIHSPRIPNRDEMIALLSSALKVLSPAQLWVNPDCGLKTRQWKEVRVSLAVMVEAAQTLRKSIANSSS